MSASAHGGTEHAHPTPATYAKIAAVLCIITAIEFGVFYTPVLHNVLVPILIVLSTIKFALVVMYYMHLKFDHPVFTRLLLGGMALGTCVLLSLLVLFLYSHPLGA